MLIVGSVFLLADLFVPPIRWHCSSIALKLQQNILISNYCRQYNIKFKVFSERNLLIRAVLCTVKVYKRI